MQKFSERKANLFGNISKRMVSNQTCTLDKFSLHVRQYSQHINKNLSTWKNTRAATTSINSVKIKHQKGVAAFSENSRTSSMVNASKGDESFEYIH